MSTPAPPPEAALLRLARKAAGITVADAAKAAGISKAWLSSIENGFDTRSETGVRPVRAKDDVVARLAAFLRISPERLETDGQRPDAAAVLREMFRNREYPQAPAPPREGGDTAPGSRYTDPALQHIWETPGLSDEVKLGLIALARGMRQTAEEERRRALRPAGSPA